MSTGTGKAATKSEKGAEGQLLGFANTLMGETDPVRQELSKQYTEALQTGGVGAQIPLIQAAQEQSRGATSRALALGGEDLSRMGLGGTPYGARQMLDTRLAGEEHTQQIPAQITSQFLAGAPQFAFGGVGPALGGLGQLSGQGASRDIAKGQELSSLWGGAAQGLLSGVGTGAGAAVMT